MTRTKLDNRFFGTTRGKIVTLLRGNPRTVSELAAELELTDNAVRAHLLSLERDNLVRQAGIQRGTRKPHFSYQLTEEAEHLFPKAYDAILNQLIAALKQRLEPEALEEVLREVGRSLAEGQGGDRNRADLETRVAKALTALEAVGGSAQVEKEGEKVFIRSESCPFSAAVVAHPEVCGLAESLLSEIIGMQVRERCNREASPRCRFEVID